MKFMMRGNLLEKELSARINTRAKNTLRTPMIQIGWLSLAWSTNPMKSPKDRPASDRICK
jgi:hypothetical protein